MALAQHAPTISRPIHGLPCSIGRLLTTLNPDDVSTLADCLADDDWTNEMIYQLVTADGHDVGRQSIGRHRRGQCRCVA